MYEAPEVEVRQQRQMSVFPGFFTGAAKDSLARDTERQNKTSLRTEQNVRVVPRGSIRWIVTVVQGS